jgi:hypothetical protein
MYTKNIQTNMNDSTDKRRVRPKQTLFFFVVTLRNEIIKLFFFSIQQSEMLFFAVSNNKLKTTLKTRQILQTRHESLTRLPILIALETHIFNCFSVYDHSDQ